ncbi:4-hydroxybenzoate polyprenyl transferase, partial [Collybia nuda]
VELTRFDVFVGGIMIFWPIGWSITMIAKSLQINKGNLASLLLAAFTGAACIWNDIVDHDIDCQVERTKHRPVADGRISITGALVFLLVHISMLVQMIQYLEPPALQVAIVYIFILPGIYPFMKRITYWPQAFLSISVCMGIPVATCAMGDTFPSSAAFLFAAGCFWIMLCDTVYAHQDISDDLKAGVYSTAVLFRENAKYFLHVLGILIAGCLLLSGVMNHSGPLYFILSVGGGTLHLWKQLSTVDLKSPKSCGTFFSRNSYVFGTTVFFGALLDYASSI